MAQNTVLIEKKQVTSTNFTKNCELPQENDINIEIGHAWKQKMPKLGPSSPSQR